MKNILSYPLSVISYLFFFLTLVIFHVIQWISLKLGGYKAHKKSVDYFTLVLMRCLDILGSRFSFENTHNIPEDKPCIFVSNHQSLYDIPLITWYLKKHHPKFVSKKELGKGIPGVSFNLRHGGSVLIDRKNPRESLVKMAEFAKYLKETNRSAVIFPEGTRSRTGKPKKFAVRGLQILIRQMPDAVIVPLTINNSWKLFRYGMFPLDLGIHFKLKVHEPIPVNSSDPESLIALTERTIIKDIE
ncbi:lysophospholipid acyltransferase family protein [Autumnicola musiva]|uniref:Lysophospholipid acyltransferase family protein n=1 Tax=Autumnicola musiva TaxID=3075589 RepID=A0ABU3D174_9FLAO|nr:lysophospholipid acyltransferase family protein [Zunongwangia sp. F117]MDT0675286.1 lysophospholipid acyltransferase family protein [Zunongwangia sp. F117]